MAHKQARERRKRLKRLYNKTKNSYGAGAYYDERKKRFIRYSCHKKSVRVFFNRKARRYFKNHPEEFVGKGNPSKKLGEYEWEIF